MTRKVIKNLSLSEISFVTVPAQAKALATIMKFDVSELVEKLSTVHGAKSFGEFLASDVEETRAWRAQEKVWPVVNAFRDTINSIVGDATISGEEKTARISAAAGEFVGAIHAYIPDVQETLLKMFNPNEKENVMTDVNIAKVAELEAENAKLSILAKMSDSEKAFYAGLKGIEADLFKSADSASRAVMMKADEVIKVDNSEIRKSVVGDVAFAVIKKQAEDLAKRADELEKAKAEDLEKSLKVRAGAELDKLPGDELAKVALLKAVHALPESVRATFDAIVKAGNAAASGAFVTVGTSAGVTELEKADARDVAVRKYMEANPTVSRDKAAVAVMSANPDLY